MLPLPLFMGTTQKYHSLKKIGWIIPLVYMQPQKEVMN